MGNLDIRLVSYEENPNKDSTEQMNRAAGMKMLNQRFEIWKCETIVYKEIKEKIVKTYII